MNSFCINTKNIFYDECKSRERKKKSKFIPLFLIYLIKKMIYANVLHLKNKTRERIRRIIHFFSLPTKYKDEKYKNRSNHAKTKGKLLYSLSLINLFS
jgi:hypothetical protein